MLYPFASLVSRRAPGARRVFVLLGFFGLSLGLAGCFNAKSAPGDEAAAVAEALTRSVSFVGGSLEDGPLPGSDDDSVSLVPLESSVLLVPGVSNLMSLMPDNPDPSDSVDAVLVQFGKANKHIEVSVGGSFVGSDEGGSPVSLEFDVADEVCNQLCNKRFTVQVKQQLKLRSGKLGRAVSRSVQLECSEHGSSTHCADSAGTGNTGTLEQRVISNLDRCGLVAKGGNLSVSRLPCLWDCLASLDCSTLSSALCDGSEDIANVCASSCLDEALEEFTCNDSTVVPQLYVCDGEEDCPEGDDEAGCSTFTCDGLTMPDYYRCDLAEDCSDGSDELGCVELNCGGDVIGTAGGSGASGAAGGMGLAGTGGVGGEAGKGEPADAGTAGIGGTGGVAGIGGFAGVAGVAGGIAGTGGLIAPAGEYGASCTIDADCIEGHCVSTLVGNLCSTTCDGATTCPMFPGIPLAVPCGSDGVCGSDGL